MTKSIELLCPAKNADIGIEALRHGADAVYIGGPSFGARASAGNEVEAIARLCEYAHIYGARVYVALNTILYDAELGAVERLIYRLYEVGVDALIVQDLALLKMKLPPIALHSSTQMDTCTPEQARLLDKAGYSQIVVARELSLRQIRAMSEVTTVPIEAFVHGALCVSYSGRCYVSQYAFGRSANRGCCAQFCRLSFDLIDADGAVISTGHHLSLRDMNRTHSIEQMLEAGVRSFKVEGRLKDAGYVKNVAAHYRTALDLALAKHPALYHRASFGRSKPAFVPQVEKTFNRGFTEYFLHGRTKDVWSMKTPKAIGAPVGRVASVGKKSFHIKSDCEFANGDGLCFFDDAGKLQGFRVNRVEGKELFPLQMPAALHADTELFRNEDRAFERALHRPSAERVLAVKYTLKESHSTEGYVLTAKTESGVELSLTFETPIEEARSPQREQIAKQLSKLGGTCFEATEVVLDWEGERFIPASALAEWRRAMTSALREACIRAHRRDKRRPMAADFDLSGRIYDFTANVSNVFSSEFLQEHGAERVEAAYEIAPPPQATLMTCRHCLRYAHGQCPKETKRPPQWKEPLALRLPDGRVFPLTFDCVKCEMSVHHQ